MIQHRLKIQLTTLYVVIFENSWSRRTRRLNTLIILIRGNTADLNHQSKSLGLDVRVVCSS